MPGFLVHVGATIQCSHPPGKAEPSTPPPTRVLVMGQPVVTQACPYVIAGCALTGSPNPPCATALWTTAAKQVFAGGVPVLLVGSQAKCAPTGTPLLIVATQIRVSGK
jgi:hypothetical protein